MKIRPLSIGSLLACLVLGGCGSTAGVVPAPYLNGSPLASQPTETAEGQAEPADDATDTSIDDASDPDDSQNIDDQSDTSNGIDAFSHMAIFKDGSGREVGVMIKLSDPVRGTDQSAMESLYSDAGGTSPVPCFSGRDGGNLDSWAVVPIQDTRVWVGTITLSNLTPTFSWPGFMDITLSNGNVSTGFGWSDGPACGVGSELTPNGRDGVTPLRIPFVIVQHDAYSPNTPSGGEAPSLDISMNGMDGDDKSEVLPS